MTRAKKIVLGLLVGIPAVCCLGGVLVFLVQSRTAHDDVLRARLQAQQAGMPLTFAEVLPPPVPESTNAAPLYERAAESLGGSLKATQSTLVKGRSIRANPKDREASNEAFTKVKPVLASLSDLPSKPNCRFERNWRLGYHLTYPELFPMKSLSNDFAFQAQDEDAAGDKAAAVRSLAMADRIAKDVGADPILIAMLVQCASEQACNKTYEKIIDRNSRNVPLLNQLEDQLRAFESLPDLRHALAGELVLERETLREVQSMREFTGSSTDDGPPKPSGAEKMLFRSQLAQDTLEAELLDKWRLAWVKFPKDKNDWAAFGSALKTMQEAVKADHSLGNRINQVLMPVFSQVADLVGVLQARNRLLLCSIELLKRRDRDGKLPSALPAELGSLAIDPFDGKPLRYIPKGQGFTLYSIGRDRTADGGHVQSPADRPDTHYDEVVEFGG